MTTAPTIVTDRLTLAMPVPADLDDFAAMLADPAVYATLAGVPELREHAWHRLLRYIGHWRVAGYGHWFARETATGRFVGSVGLMDSRRATDPGFEGTAEAGWVLASWAHGRGFAHEALVAMLGWADANAVAPTVCIIDSDNAPSIRLAARLGYALRTTGTYRDQPIGIYDRA